MSGIAAAFASAWRNYVTDGVSSSGAHKPAKADLRALGDTIQSEVVALVDADVALSGRMDDVEAIAVSGINPLPNATGTVRVRSTGNVDLTNALENGDTLNGVTLATGDHVFLPCQSAGATLTDAVTGATNSPANGIYTVVASGAASRATFADSAAELELLSFTISEGTVGLGETWMLPLMAADINLGTTGLAWSRRGIHPDYATEVQTASADYLELGDRLDDIPFPAPLVDDYKELVVDSAGKPVSGVRFDGSEWLAVDGSMVQIGSKKIFTNPTITFETTGYSGIPSDALTGNVDYGILDIDQSIFGLSTDAGDATISSVAQHPGYALMQATGVAGTGIFARLSDVLYDWGDYTDLVESYLAGAYYETPASGMLDAIMRRCDAAFSAKPRIIITASIRGGSQYKLLKRGSNWYEALMRAVRRNVAISKYRYGRRYEVLCVTSFHGQNDWVAGVDQWEYLRFMTEWQADFDHDIRAITGQSRPVKMYFAQTGVNAAKTTGIVMGPAVAQLAAPRHNPMLRCAGATYQSLGADDNTHYKAEGFYHMGLLMGRAIFDGEWGYNQRPLECIDAWWTSTSTVRLKYNMPIALESTDDIIKISDLGDGKGVDFVDGSVSPVTVSGIAVASSVYLDVTLSGAPTGNNPRLYIASRASDVGASLGGTGAIEGNRSAIRAATAYDTAPLTSADLYQWAPMQELKLGKP